jgi:hypothetical protein
MITHANLSHLHKILYPFGMQDVLYDDCTLAGLLKKSARFQGESFVVPLKFSPGHKASPSFTEAQVNHDRSRGTRFIYTDSFKNYGIFQMSTEAIKRAKGGAGSFRDAVKDEIDSTLHDMSKDIAAALYGNGGGAIGQVSAFDTTGNGTVTLTDPADIIHFEVGMRVQPATTDGTSGSVIADIVAIATIDRDAGTFTLAAAPSNDANWAAPNFLFKAGAFGAMAAGLEAHVPAAAPSATLFRGVDRTLDAQKLGGNRYVGDPNVDGTIVRAIQNAVSKVKRHGAWARPDTVLAGTGVYQQILNECEDKTVIKKDAVGALGGKAAIGYEGVAIQVGKAGKLNVFEDAFCPEDTVWGLRLDTWEIAYVPDLWMSLLTEAGDGGKLSIYNADGVEWRYASMWDLVCHAPGANVRIDVSDLIAA